MNMSQTDPHSIFESLINRYLAGELSPDEENSFQKALEAEPSLRKDLESYERIWGAMEGMEPTGAYDLDEEWKLLRDRIPGWPGEKGNAILKRPVLLRSLGSRAYRIAALLATGLIFAFAVYYAGGWTGGTKVVAGNEPAEVRLEDGSEVVLNRYSTLRYPKNMYKRGRRVSLTGEAWFRVARDTANPFTIDAGTAVVEVLGTSFNVNAYRGNPVVEITVESGMVALSPKQDKQDQIVLKAGNSGTYHTASRELVLVPESDPNNLSWKTRELYFENSSLKEVASLVGRVYNVHIEFENPDLMDCPITVTFRDQSLQSVLSVLELTMDLEISRSGSTIILDGGGCDP